MNRTRLLCLPLVLAACAATGNAGLLYTFGDNFGPFALSSMNPASAASVTTVNPQVGDGNSGFNGGLVAANGLLYAIGNDSNNVATLYSMNTAGLDVSPVSSDFNNTGAAAGVIFSNGLAAAGSNFYAIGQGATTENLYLIGAGSATDIQTLNTMNGNYAGLAWDAALNEFYAILENVNLGDFHGDYLVKFQLGGAVHLVANLTALDGAGAGTHLGGLADTGAGILFDIYTNTNSINNTGLLEEIDLNGLPAVSTLYDTGIPLAQNAGIAFIPEPAPPLEIGAGLLLLCCAFRRRGIGGRRPQAAAARCSR